MALFRLVASKQETDQMAEDYRTGAIDYLGAKLRLLEATRSFFGRYESAYRDWCRRRLDVSDILDEGTRLASESFQEVTDRICSRLGLHDLLRFATQRDKTTQGACR